MKPHQVFSVLLPGADDTVEVEVNYVHNDAYLPGQEGGELAHPQILSADHEGNPLDLADDGIYWAIVEAMV